MDVRDLLVDADVPIPRVAAYDPRALEDVAKAAACTVAPVFSREGWELDTGDGSAVPGEEDLRCSILSRMSYVAGSASTQALRTGRVRVVREQPYGVPEEDERMVVLLEVGEVDQVPHEAPA
jgi:hypothetical protein